MYEYTELSRIKKDYSGAYWFTVTNLDGELVDFFTSSRGEGLFKVTGSPDDYGAGYYGVKQIAGLGDFALTHKTSGGRRAAVKRFLNM